MKVGIEDEKKSSSSNNYIRIRKWSSPTNGWGFEEMPHFFKTRETHEVSQLQVTLHTHAKMNGTPVGSDLT